MCGNPTARGTPFVLGGEVVSSAEEVPWHAVVYKQDRGRWLGICGGSLVTPNFVVSGHLLLQPSSFTQVKPVVM